MVHYSTEGLPKILYDFTVKSKFTSSKSKVNDIKSMGPNPSISLSINITCKCNVYVSNINEENVTVVQLTTVVCKILNANKHRCHNTISIHGY